MGTDLEGMPEFELDINTNITKLGFTSGVHDLVYNFHRDAVGAQIGPKFRVQSISSDRTEIRIIPSVAEDDEVNYCLQETLNPKGVAVVIEAQHLCMQMRGIQKQHSSTTTSAFSGIFMSDEKTRAEFMTLIR
jgi:hypothetical protein